MQLRSNIVGVNLCQRGEYLMVTEEGGSYKAYDDGYNALCGTDTGWQADNYGSSKEVLTRH